MTMPVRISSNATLFFTLFVPTFWMAFFGIFSITVFVSNLEYYGSIPGVYMRWGTFLFYALGALLLYFTLMQLKRVEISTEHLYLTNYFKHRRYILADIAQIRTRDFGLFKLGTIDLKAPGSFGRRIRFLVSHKYFDSFWQSHPELAEKLLSGGFQSR
jgi:hypothetical protein